MADEYISKIQITEEGDEVPIRDIGAVRYAELFDLIYPVGSIYMSATLSTPEAVSAVFGGTWEKWGEGRVPVGVDTSQTEFATVEKKDGAKTVTLTAEQSGVRAHAHGVGTIVAKLVNHVHSMTHTHSVSGNTGSAGSHNHGTGGSSYTRFVVALDSTVSTDVGSPVSGSHAYPTQKASGGFSSRSTIGSASAHHHSISLTSGGSSAANTGNPTSLGNCTMSGSTANNTAANASSAHNNLQPYITCYMYKRTAL